MKKQLFRTLIVALMVLTQIDAYSFNKSIQVLVKGKITNENTGMPVEAQLEFRDQTGKKIKTKSNIIDGSWEQIFNAGDKLEVIISNWDVARKLEKLIVTDTNVYFEQKKDFTAKKFEVGKPIFQLNIFEPISAKFVSNYNLLIDSLKDVLLFSRNIKVELRVNSHDSYAKVKSIVPIEKPIKKKKKNKKEPEISSEPQIIIKNPDKNLVNSLVESRATELDSYIKDWLRFIDRMKVVGDFSSLEEKDGANLNLNYDYEVIVTELKNTLEK